MNVVSSGRRAGKLAAQQAILDFASSIGMTIEKVGGANVIRGTDGQMQALVRFQTGLLKQS